MIIKVDCLVAFAFSCCGSTSAERLPAAFHDALSFVPFDALSQGDMRRCMATTYDQLEAFVCETFGLDRATSNFQLKYTDDEGDLITLSSTLELNEAIQLTKELDRPSLKITVMLPSGSAATPAPAKQAPAYEPEPAPAVTRVMTIEDGDDEDGGSSVLRRSGKKLKRVEKKLEKAQKKLDKQVSILFFVLFCGCVVIWLLGGFLLGGRVWRKIEICSFHLSTSIHLSPFTCNSFFIVFYPFVHIVSFICCFEILSLGFYFFTLFPHRFCHVAHKQ
jgi:hypothetical protein